MKKIIFLLIALLMLMTLYAQPENSLVKESMDSKCKDLITQLNILLIFGQPFAQENGLTAAEYGQYVGEFYIKNGWAEGGNFEALTHACLFNLSCHQPDSQIEIISQTDKMVKIKSKITNGFTRKNEPCFLITYQDYQQFFNAALSAIAKHGGCNYSVSVDDDMVYTTISKGE